MAQQALATLAALLIPKAFPEQASAAAGDSIKDTVWRPLCTVAGELAEAEAIRKQQLATSILTADKWLKDKLRLVVYYARQPTSSATVREPLVTAVPQMPTITANQLKSAADKAVTATAAGSYLQGRIAEFATIAASASSSSGTHGCLYSGGGSSAVEGPGRLPPCGTLNTFGRRPGTSRTVSDPQTIFDNLGTGTTDALQAGAPQNCALTKHNNPSLVWTQAVGAGVSYAGGAIILDVPGGTTKEAARPTKQSGKYAGDTLYANVGNALIEAADDATARGQAYTQYDVQQLKTNNAAREAAHHQLLKKTTKYDPNTDAGPVADKLAEIYKDSDKETDLKVWKDIKATQIPKKEFSDEDTGETPLSDIQTVDQLLKLLTRSIIAKNHEIIKLKADLAATQNTKAAANPEETCNKITQNDAAACNATKGCHFVESNDKGKKCTLTKEAAAEAAKESANKETEGKDGKNKDGKTCADFKTEAECNAAEGPKPTGKSKFCGWIGEDPSGGDKGFKCRSSSFLLNKQFALSVVSAAFAALLF
uniref:Variant surface glycoprotein 320 n=1 Tax=Trypanosoma brucei TaxID=5691 RepID=M4TD00_9TRYP|nr:variant surface glycoprotein 320 [Trypanosoma brucei]